MSALQRILISVFILLIAQTTIARSPDDRENVSRMGRWGYGCIYDVEARGDTVFVASGAMLEITNCAAAPDVTVIGRIEIDSTIHSMDLVDNLVLLGTDDSGLYIVSFADPTNPVQLGRVDPDDEIISVCIDGDTAWLSTDGDLRSVDFSNPASPLLSGFLDTGSYILDLAINGDYLYAADDEGYVQVIDATTPALPAIVTSIPGDGSHAVKSVFTEGGLIYFTDDYTNFYIYDISTPSLPVIVTSFWMDDIGEDVHVDGGIAYVAGAWEGLFLFDVSIPSATSFISAYDAYPGDVNQSYRLALGGGRVYLADHERGLDMIDVTTPAAPTGAGQVRASYMNHDIGWYHGYALVPDYHYGLRIIDCRDVSDPVLVASLPLDGNPYQIDVSGDLAVITAASAGLYIIDVSDPEAPSIAGHYDDGGSYNAVVVDPDDGLVYVGKYGGYLLVLNIAVPAAPTPVGGYQISEFTRGLFIDGDRLYQAVSFPEKLVIFNISVPTNITTLGMFNNYAMSWDGAPWDVCARNGVAYLAMTWGGLDILDVSDPSGIFRLATRPVGSSCFGVAVNGDHVFMATSDDGLEILDVSMPSTPVRVGRYWTGGISWQVTIGGGNLLVADHNTGFTILSPDALLSAVLGEFAARRVSTGAEVYWSLSNPDKGMTCNLSRSIDDVRWQPVHDLSSDELAQGAFLDQDAPRVETAYRLEARYVDGTMIELGQVRLPALAVLIAPSLSPPAPNPFNPGTRLEFKLPQPTHARLDIHDGRGRLIARLVDADLGAGPHFVEWDGRNNEGRTMPSGLYFARLRTRDHVRTQKLIMSR
jgi:hypothetical protein